MTLQSLILLKIKYFNKPSEFPKYTDSIWIKCAAKTETYPFIYDPLIYKTFCVPIIEVISKIDLIIFLFSNTLVGRIKIFIKLFTRWVNKKICMLDWPK